jgi:chemotaxis protein MotB
MFATIGGFITPPVKTLRSLFFRIAFAQCLAWTAILIPAPAYSELDLTGVNSVRIGQAAMTFAAGFIRPSLPADGSVSLVTGDTQVRGNRFLLGQGDVTYIKLIKPAEFSPGDHLTLYRRAQEVFHPTTRRLLGNLYIMVGVVTISQISENLATVRVVRSYGVITSGDGAMRFVAPPPPEPAPANRTLPTLTGQIIALPYQQLLIGQANIVYIDRGRNDGLYVGDRLDVFRVGAGLPPRLIGEIKILALEDTTATALVTRSFANILRGDRFVIKEPVVKGAPPETLSEELDRLTKSRVEQAAAAPQSVEAPQKAGELPGNLEDQLATLARQLEFEPGESPVKPAGLPVLKQIGDLLKTVTDRHIMIAGHTDNRPIGPTLKQQFPTNQELAQARATGVVRYLVDEEGLDQASLSAVGYADRQPVASNSTEEGRKKNRRIEIKLFPKTVPILPVAPEAEPVATLPPLQEPVPSAAAASPAEGLPPAGEVPSAPQLPEQPSPSPVPAP